MSRDRSQLEGGLAAHKEIETVRSLPDLTLAVIKLKKSGSVVSPGTRLSFHRLHSGDEALRKESGFLQAESRERREGW